MLVKIKENAGNNYSDFGKQLANLRGQWVKVDTSALFNDQYNLLEYPLRVFDSDISAVKDDARRGLVKCGYCGKQFHSMDELKKHYEEEEENAGRNCESCFYFMSKCEKTEHEEKKENAPDGLKIVTNTTKYYYRKKCTYKGNCSCTRLEHRKHKPFIFSEENTYFLKYPNGYGFYFHNLPTPKKWRELGYTWDESGKTATKESAAGTYAAIHYFKNDGEPERVELKNSKKTFTISAENLKLLYKDFIYFHRRLLYNEEFTKGMPEYLPDAICKYFESIWRKTEGPWSGKQEAEEIKKLFAGEV